MLLWNRDLVIGSARHRVYAAVVTSDGKWLLRQGGFGKVSEVEISEDEAEALLCDALGLVRSPLKLAAMNSPTLINILDRDDGRYASDS